MNKYPRLTKAQLSNGNYDEVTKKLLRDKIEFVARYISEIYSKETIVVDAITCIPELSTSEIFIEGFNRGDVYFDFYPRRVSVFIGNEEDLSDEDLDEYKAIKTDRNKIVYYLVVNP